MKALLKQSLDFALDTILPPRCVISGEKVDRQGMIAPATWNELNFVTAPHCDTCGFPFDFDVTEGSLCASCLDYPPKFDSARAALVYNDAGRDLVLGFKHADKTYAVKAFTPWIERAGQSFLMRADYLLPVPLHPMRLIARRYNQAALMAQDLTLSCGVPTLVDALARIRATASQGHLSAGDRHKNVRKAFAVNPKRAEAIKGKVIVLIDDVYTTGATVNECTKALKKAGAAEVHILTLCRVVRGGFG